MGEEPHGPPLAKGILAVAEGGELPPSGAQPVVGLLREESPLLGSTACGGVAEIPLPL